MKFVGRFGLVAALAFTAGTFAEDSIPTGAEVRQVIARAATGSVRPAIATDAIALDDFAGRYDTAEGMAVFVNRDGDSLALEVSDSTLPTNLVRLDARTFASGDDSVIVSFQTDSAGRVNGLVLSTASTESTLAAARAAPRHGIVTIHDGAPPRRGIVTIHDVREEIARL
jgi:hypothetical protein